jgi:D-amino peptidase
MGDDVGKVTSSGAHEGTLLSLIRSLIVIPLIATIPGLGVEAQPAGPKVYISADMEGVVGVVTGEQLGTSGFEYARFRELMTAEVLAAIDGARAAGAGEIVVSDSHGNMQNLLIEKLPADIRLIRGAPRPLGMMEGIDESFDAVVFIGYHAATSNPRGVRAHTYSSARLADVRLNGESVPEGVLNAAVAGHFGVPVIMVSGDDVAVAELQSVLGDVEGAVVKRAIGFHAAESLMPQKAYELIRERVRIALSRLDQFRPYRVTTPVTLEVRFKNYRPSEVLSWLPDVERIDSHTIRFVGRDVEEIARFLNFVNYYDPGLEP